MAPTICPAISRTKSNAWGSKHRPPSCASPRATASRALHPHLTWGRSGQGGRIRVTSADLQYLFGIQRSEPDCMTRLVSEHDQTHIRSTRETAAPISRLRRSGLRKTRPFLKTGFLGHVRMRFVHLDPPGLIKSWKI